MTDAVQHKRFEFGTVFGDGGRIVSAPAPREKRSYTPEEVEAIRLQAYADGEGSAVAQGQAQQAAALNALAQAAQAGLSGIAEAVHAHKAAAVKLALACAQKIGAEALEQFPQAPLTAALEALGAEIEPAARLVLFCNDPSDELKSAAEQAAAMSGFAGAIQFRTNPALPRGAFEVIWNDGRAEYDPQRIYNTLHTMLNEALEAEKYHQDRINSDASHS